MEPNQLNDGHEYVKPKIRSSFTQFHVLRSGPSIPSIHPVVAPEEEDIVAELCVLINTPP